MDKSLGTNLHLWRFSHVPNEQPGANSSSYVQPLPLPPLQRWTRVHAIFLEVQHCLAGGGGSKGGKATHFETENSAFLKLRFKHTEN